LFCIFGERHVKFTEETRSENLERSDGHSPELAKSDSEASPDSWKEVRRDRTSGKYTLVTQVAGQSFRYAFLNRKGDLIEVGSFGEICLKDLDVDSNDPVELHKTGMSWLRANSDLSYDRTILVDGRLDFFVRRLELPRLKRHEVRDAAAWEVEKQIPIAVKESYLLLKQNRLAEGFIDIIAAAVPRRQIDCWQHPGKRLAGIAPVPVCLACLGPKSESREEAYCYVYEGDSVIDVGFYNSSGLQYVHSTSAGETADQRASGETVFSRERILEELINSIEIFFGRFPDMTIMGVILLTSSDNGPALEQMISQRIDIRTVTVDPNSILNRESRELSMTDPRYLPLLGAALLERDSFVYIPETLRREIRHFRIRKYRNYLLAAGIAFNALAGSIWIGRSHQAARELSRIEQMRATMESSEAYVKCLEYRSGTAFLTILSSQLRNRDDYHSRFLKILSNITPAGIYLDNATLSGGDGQRRFKVEGYFDGNLKKSEVALIHFTAGFETYGMKQLKLQRLGKKISGTRRIESFVLDGKW
jgi:hypothetical protein